jgi:hypothetical protein
MSSEEEFGSPHFRIASLASPQRRARLQSPQLAFAIPPRTDSFTFLDAQTVSAHLSRSNSTVSVITKQTCDFLEDEDDDVPGFDIDAIRAKLQSFIQNCPDFLRVAVDRLVNGENQILIDILDKRDFVPLSSILQVHRHMKALIVCPSNKILQWVRSFLVDSTSLCPETRSEQQTALSKLSSSRTQVLLCLAKSCSTLPITNFHFDYVVKTELCKSDL